MSQVQVSTIKNKVRFITAASLFDGHDATINVMRRVLQQTGVEVIHLGHNRSVEEIVNAALQEDVQGIAITSYQGGHIEFFKYMYDLLQERGGANIKIFGGGGGVIVLEEIKELHEYGIARIYSPEDGQKMGLQGMINEVVETADEDLSLLAPQGIEGVLDALKNGSRRDLARVITALENGSYSDEIKKALIDEAASIAGGARSVYHPTLSLFTEWLLLEQHIHRELECCCSCCESAILLYEPNIQLFGFITLGNQVILLFQAQEAINFHCPR